MTDLEPELIDLEPACRSMIEVLADIDDDRFARATPCTAYTVGDLIGHVDDAARGFAAVARKQSAASGTPADTVPDDAAAVTDADAGTVVRHPDWRARVTGHVRALGASWQDPAAWRGSSEAAGVELPNALWGRIALTEMVVHGWDLATALGRPFAPPEATLRACLDHVAVFLPQAPLPDLWGPAVDVPDDAPLLDRIVALTGRTP